MEEGRRHPVPSERFASDNIDSVAAWRAARSDPGYSTEAARQAASAAAADVDDRVMEWVEGVSAEAWDDL